MTAPSDLRAWLGTLRRRVPLRGEWEDIIDELENHLPALRAAVDAQESAEARVKELHEIARDMLVESSLGYGSRAHKALVVWERKNAKLAEEK